jgi:CHAT domain-containing protein
MGIYAPALHQPSYPRNLPLAIWYGKQAVNTLQSVRGDLKSLDKTSQQSFLKANEFTYTRLAELLIESGRIPEAEQVLAMLKESELADLLVRSEPLKGQVGAASAAERQANSQQAALASRGLAYATELADLERREKVEGQLSASDDARRQALLRQAEQWRGEFQRFLASMSTLFAPSATTSAKGQADQSATGLELLVADDPGAVGLHYVVTEERIAIIVATASGSFGRFSAVKRSELANQISALRQALTSKADTAPAAQVLYRMLIAPVAADLEAAKASTLVLSLTDALRYLPFAALQDAKGDYLVQRYALALYASSGQSRAQANAAPWRVSAMGLTQAQAGFSALPAVRGELAGIVRADGAAASSSTGVLPGTISLDEAFGRPQLQAALNGRQNVVHIASHFSFVPGDESRSVLLLGQGEPISLGQLAVMNFRSVEQLTLSACETATGGGTNDNGAEVEGLAAAVQRRGAQAVLATLWKVADSSTAQLMRSFYAQRATDKPGDKPVGRAQALRQAQLAMLAGSGGAGTSPTVPVAQRGAVRTDAPAASITMPLPVDPARPYAHPYFWAPFVLSGNWL